MKHPCAYCGDPIDPGTPGVGREITGWEKVRADGGAHSIIARQETNRYACRTCLNMIRQGHDPRSQVSDVLMPGFIPLPPTHWTQESYDTWERRMLKAWRERGHDFVAETLESCPFDRTNPSRMAAQVAFHNAIIRRARARRR